MTDSEIIKALECCVNNQHCWLCVLKDREDDCHDILKSALDLINRQQAEIDRLNIDLKAMRGAANSWKAEVQRICKREFDNIEIDIEAVKSATVKEFAEKLKSRKRKIIINDNCSSASLPLFIILPDDIDKLMEEMGCNDG